MITKPHAGLQKRYKIKSTDLKIMFEEIRDKKRLTALITGASSGLGESIAKNLAGRAPTCYLVSENGRIEACKKQIMEYAYNVSVSRTR